MRYMMMIKCTKDSEAGIPPNPELMAGMAKLTEEMVKAGKLLASDGLQPTSKGTRLKYSGGKRTVIDGPFAEAKELIGGYWMIQVKSKEEAIEWAKRCPASRNEVIEVRQVQELADFPAHVQEAAAKLPEMQAQPGRRRGRDAAAS